MSWLDPLFLKYRQIMANGLPFPRRATTNYLNGTIVDNPSNDSTDITIGAVGGGALISLADGASPFLIVSVPPAAASFSATNLLGATLADDALTKTRLVTVPGNRAAGANSRAIWHVATPPPPYVFEVGLVPMYNSSNPSPIGLMVGDSAGKFIEAGTYLNSPSGGERLNVSAFTNPTTAVGSLIGTLSCSFGATPRFLRVVDPGPGTGNTLDFYVSVDGKNWQLILQEIRVTHLGTIDRIGICADNVDAGPTVALFNVIHWKVG